MTFEQSDKLAGCGNGGGPSWISGPVDMDVAFSETAFIEATITTDAP